MPLKPSWEKGTQLGVHCGDEAVAGVAIGGCSGRGGDSRLRLVLVGFIVRPLVKVGTSRGVCGLVKKEKKITIRPIAREGVREGNVGEFS